MKKSCSNSDCPEKNPQPIGNFHLGQKTRDGRKKKCRICSNAYSRKWHSENRAKAIKSAKDYRDSDRGRDRNAVRHRSKKYREYQRKWNKSESGKQSHLRYRRSSKGIANMLWHSMQRRCANNPRYTNLDEIKEYL